MEIFLPMIGLAQMKGIQGISSKLSCKEDKGEEGWKDWSSLAEEGMTNAKEYCARASLH